MTGLDLVMEIEKVALWDYRVTLQVWLLVESWDASDASCARVVQT
jgi:hypothetical protein